MANFMRSHPMELSIVVNLAGKECKWLKIAYRNNETIKEDIQLISFLNNRIYGISRDNNLYLGEHRSEGNLTARALAIKGGEQTVSYCECRCLRTYR